MKTPEDIKKGLECCSDSEGFDGDCIKCPYKGEQWCGDKSKIDALSYIQQLENQIGELTEMVAQLEAAQPKWISVEEQPPELPCICYDGENLPHEVMQIYTLSSLKLTRYFSYDPFELLEMIQQECDSDETIDIGSMTHILFWMPLPEQPKEEA